MARNIRRRVTEARFNMAGRRTNRTLAADQRRRNEAGGGRGRTADAARSQGRADRMRGNSTASKRRAQQSGREVSAARRNAPNVKNTSTGSVAATTGAASSQRYRSARKRAARAGGDRNSAAAAAARVRRMMG